MASRPILHYEPPHPFGEAARKAYRRGAVCGSKSKLVLNWTRAAVNCKKCLRIMRGQNERRKD